MPVAASIPDLSHHLNLVSRSRHPSPLKDLLRYMVEPDMLSLAGGLPHPSLFPIADLKFNAYPANTFLDPYHPGIPQTLEAISISKTGKNDELKLDNVLQYSTANGLPQLREFARAFTKSILKPAYSEYEILVSSGNTDAWAKVQGLLSEKGDWILVEEHTYPSAQAHWIPHGCRAVPLKMDSQGIRADYLAHVLDSWESTRPGEKKPHVLYTVPVGQNPTGTTMGGIRKAEIYEIAVKHDIIIVEDDPYYFLQYSAYTPNVPPTQSVDPTAYVESLVPSFLNVDYQGRVIRLETFSKTLAPGCRLGYFVCNPVFAERLLRATEVETQTASGFSQAIIAAQLSRWGQAGYLLWLSNLCEQYRIRRDWLMEGFASSFDLTQEKGAGGSQVTVGRFKHIGGTEIPRIQFVCPSAGMFIFVRVMLKGMPNYDRTLSEGVVSNVDETVMNELWQELIQAKTLLVPGSYYAPWQGRDAPVANQGHGHFRFAYSVATRDELALAVSRFEAVLRKFWGYTSI